MGTKLLEDKLIVKRIVVKRTLLRIAIFLSMVL